MRGPLIRSILVIPAYFFVNSVFSTTDSPYVTTTTTTTTTTVTKTVVTRVSSNQPSYKKTIEKTTTVTNVAPSPNITHISTPNTGAQTGLFPWPFRATAWGLGGNRNVGVGDAMLPLFGNDYGMFYADAQGKYAYDSNWLMSIGGGYRQLYNCERILGAYVFADHNEYKNTSFSTSSFWMISPGIESLGNVWDFRVNGYIPVTSQTENKGTFFGDQLGMSNVIVFQGHSQYDQLFTISNNVGPGFDGEIGYTLPLPNHNTRVYLGGYYFSPKNSDNIRGIAGRVEFPLNHYFALTAADTYDNNVNNSFEAGLKITIGGNTDDQTVKDIGRRFVDPIPRNLATLSQGTGAPVVTTTTGDGLVLERTNIYFFTAGAGTTTTTGTSLAATQNGLLGGAANNFNPSAGTANCTFEHPCSGTSFTQATINSINSFAPGTNFYLNTGTYSLNGQTFLNNGQSIYGRVLDFTAAALGSQQPRLIGGLSLLSNNLLDSFTLVNDGTQQAGIVLANAQNITVNNLNVGVLNNSSQGYAAAGIVLDNSSLVITNSVVNIFSNVNAASIAGIANTPAAGTPDNLILINDTINALGTGSGQQVADINYLGTNNFAVSVNNSTLNATASGNNETAINVNTSTNGTFMGVFNNSILNAMSSGTNTQLAAGINATTIGNLSIIANDDQFNANAVSNSIAAVIGLNLTINPTTNTNLSVNLNNSSININASGSSLLTVVGISTNVALNSGTANDNINLTLNNDAINASAISTGINSVSGITATLTAGTGTTLNPNINITANFLNMNLNSTSGNSGVNAVNGILAEVLGAGTVGFGNVAINLNNNTLNAVANGGNGNSVQGIIASTKGPQNNNITVNSSTVTATANGGSGNTVIGIRGDTTSGTGTNNVIVNNSTIAGNGSGTVFGVQLTDTINRNQLSLFNSFVLANRSPVFSISINNTLINGPSLGPQMSMASNAQAMLEQIFSFS